MMAKSEGAASTDQSRQGREDQKEKDRKLPENRKDRLDERLDEGSEESFPASDPVSVKITK